MSAMADDECMEDDPVVHEVDVFLSRSLASNLYLLQYPLRPAHMTYDNVEHTTARVKPKQKMVQLEIALNTKSHNYSNSRGEHIAQSVGIDRTNNDEPYFASGMMDRQVLRSSLSQADTNRCAVAVLRKDELHLTPVHAVVQMRPTFDYLDKADTKQKCDVAARDAATGGGDSSQDEEEETEAVTVKFARPESEEAKARRLASYEYIQQRMDEEPWCTLAFQKEKRAVESEFQLLYGAHGGEKQQQFLSTATQYLDVLMPKPDSDEQVKAPIPNNILTRQQLKQMTLGDAVRALLTNVKVMQFSKLMEMLPEGTDTMAALRSLQHVAVMVQGCWVVKSEVLYPENTRSPHTDVAAEHLIHGRDFLMWKFTHCKYVVRKEVACGLPYEDVKDFLEQMSKMKSSKGWEFVFDYDREFVERYPEVAQRQRMLWNTKYTQLCQHFKLPKDADKKAREGEQQLMMQNANPPRRRRASRSSPRKRTLSGRSMSDMSDWDMDIDAAGDRVDGHAAETATSEPMEVCGEGTANAYPSNNLLMNNGAVLDSRVYSSEENSGGDMKKNSDQLKRDLVLFVQETFAKLPVITFSELKRELHLKLSKGTQGNPLSSGVADHMLEEAVLSAGGAQLNKPLTSQSNTEAMFAYLHQGNRMDKARQVLFSLLEFTCKVKSSTFIGKVKETLGEEYSDAELRKLLREICESRNSLWYLRGTAPSS